MKAKHIAVWIVIVLLLLALFTLFQNPGQRIVQSDNISYSQFLAEIDAGKVREVVIQGHEISGTFNDGRLVFQTYAPYNDPALITRLYGKGVNIIGRPLRDDTPWPVTLLMAWLPFIFLITVVWILARRPGTKS